MLEQNDRISHKGLNAIRLCEIMNNQNQELSEDTILLQSSNEEFVKACYRMFFDREADRSGLQAHIKLLESGISKEGFLYHLTMMEEFRNRFQLEHIDFYKKEYLKYKWDASGVMQYEGWHFIEHCYLDLLNREPDEAGIFVYTKMLYEGMPKEGIIYIFISSQEGKAAKSFQNIEYYKQIYDSYINYENSRGLYKRIKNLLEKITKSRQIYSEMQANFALIAMKQEKLESEMNRAKKR